jgi:hypothetical protein
VGSAFGLLSGFVVASDFSSPQRRLEDMAFAKSTTVNKVKYRNITMGRVGNLPSEVKSDSKRISDFKSQISNFRSQISNLIFQI